MNDILHPAAIADSAATLGGEPLRAAMSLASGDAFGEGSEKAV